MAPSIEAQVDLGSLFATVKASVIHDCVGAHVDLDGTVISDTGLYPLTEDADEVDVFLAVRAAAVSAIGLAHREIGVDFDGAARDQARRQAAAALPLPDSFWNRDLRG